MRMSIIIALVGLVFMIVGFAISLIMNYSLLLTTSLFIIGFLLNILGILMISRDYENLLIEIEVENNKPSPEDIRKRPLRKPKKD
ncbi:MAG: hypothetical protein TU36_003235 [Vulcanisaeta sp. AZ3]|jgi:cellulose synthase/poly-beta-1,6-N-acetylglucosamine synthase-like glycosyltransferase|nr:MAG: hypothetical protein TU36_03525 [Vulcanisaeta sp. AZ3]